MLKAIIALAMIFVATSAHAGPLYMYLKSSNLARISTVETNQVTISQAIADLDVANIEAVANVCKNIGLQTARLMTIETDVNYIANNAKNMAGFARNDLRALFSTIDFSGMYDLASYCTLPTQGGDRSQLLSRDKSRALSAAENLRTEIEEAKAAFNQLPD